MNDASKQAIIENILETIARYRESVAGEVPDAVRTARFVAVGQVILALSAGNEDDCNRPHDAEIVYGLGAPKRGMVSDLFFGPPPGPRAPFRVTADMLPVVEAMFSIGLPDPGWEGVEVEIVARESFP